MADPGKKAPSGSPRISLLMIAMPLIFAVLAAIIVAGLFRDDPDGLPLVFVSKPAPSIQAQTLPGRATLTDADLRSGEVTVLNFWASWCLPCRAEHPTLMALDADGVRVTGLNVQDKAEQANAYLDGYGDPFLAVAYDPQGRTAIDWSVTALPVTVIVDGDGIVLFRFAGPLVGSDYEQRFLPELKKALAR